MPDHRRVELSPDRYDDRWRELAATGQSVHGEADLIDSLLPARGTVLDAGCGTGRVAIELSRRGFETVGIDVDRNLLDAARAKAPDLTWIEADLAAMPHEVAAGPFDAVVMAGNVMIFVAAGTEAAVVANLAGRLAPGGLLIAGFQLGPGIGASAYDTHADAAGLVPVARWSTWDRQPAAGDRAYCVAVHRRPRVEPTGSAREGA